jgi:hypothetical protein
MTTETELAVREAFTAGSPMQRLLGAVYEELGGLDFVLGWAEDNPGDFMRMLMAANPVSMPGQGNNASTLNLHVHPGLVPGPLDGAVTLDAED